MPLLSPPPMLAQFDAVIDFTTPQAVIPNMRACLANGARVVVGTTGWYDKLPKCALSANGGMPRLLYGANFSVGVQVMYELATSLCPWSHGFELSITRNPP